MKYVVDSAGHYLRISPPCWSRDVGAQGRVSELLNISGDGEIDRVTGKRDALRILRDEQLVRGFFEDDDVFFWRGETVPFARVKGWSVLSLEGF